MHKQFKMMIAASALVFAVLMTGGCSSASKVTCDQFAAMSSGKQTTTLMDMIQEHGFDPNSSVWGSAALGVEVQKYCGVSNTFGSGTATQHRSNPIENAIDWSTVGK